jgi:hypothetical protein
MGGNGVHRNRPPRSSFKRGSAPAWVPRVGGAAWGKRGTGGKIAAALPASSKPVPQPAAFRISGAVGARRGLP